jgi:hypothetical protein
MRSMVEGAYGAGGRGRSARGHYPFPTVDSP